MDVSCRWARRALGVGSLALALFAPTPVVAQAAPAGKFVWLNLQEALHADPGYAAAEAAYNKEMKGYNDEIDKLQKQFDSTLAAYQQSAVVLSPSAKTAKEAELRTLQTKLQTRMSELQTKATQRERELVGPIEERVRAVIDGIRAEKNLSLIFDRSALIAADPTLDLTPVVVQRLKGPGQ